MDAILDIITVISTQSEITILVYISKIYRPGTEASTLYLQNYYYSYTQNMV